MHLHSYKTIISIFAFGCLLPALALTEVVKTDGSVVSGVMVSKGTDATAMNIDGSNILIAQSMVQEDQSDETQSSQSVPSEMQVPVSTSNSDMESQKQEPKHFGRTEREHVTIGANVHWLFIGNVRSSKNGDATGDTVSSSSLINPYIGIHPSEKFEIRPSLYISRTHYSSDWIDNSLDSYSVSNYNSQWGLGAGVGFLFHVIHGSCFRFVLGPEVGIKFNLPPRSERNSGTSQTVKTKYDRYFDMDIPIRVPFSFDFVVSDHLGFRLSSELLNIVFGINSVKLPGDTTDGYRDFLFSSSLDLTKAITQLSIGAFLLF